MTMDPNVLKERIVRIEERVQTIADEAFGPFETMSAHDCLTAIETGIAKSRSDHRKAVAEIRAQVKHRTEQAVKEHQRAERAEDRADRLAAVVEGVREPVRWFAEQMERKLREHDDRPGWHECDIPWLLDRLGHEVVELRNAHAAQVRVWDAVADEAADVANFAMMIADHARHNGNAPDHRAALAATPSWHCTDQEWCKYAKNDEVTECPMADLPATDGGDDGN